MKRITFIVNPVSGGKDKSSVLAAVGRHMDLSLYSYEVLQTSRAGEAEEMARDSRSDIVVAVGGDGTVSEVGKGLLGSEKALGIIPCGSGDGLALHLGISRDPVRAVKTLNAGCIERMDVGMVGERPFFCTAGMGLDAAVSLDFAQSEKRGLNTYITTAWEDWKHRRPERYIVEMDTETWAGDTLFVTVGNANQWGNEARIAPHASLCDGLLDITVVQPFMTVEIPDLAARLMAGKADTSRHVRTFRSTQVRIRREHPGPAHYDGDPFEAGTDLRFSLRPGALRVVVPPSRVGKI
ncbi:MAG: diacylglycerol kinase family lipid kinase [Bacteroidales bacterium]|nr:diacylglycerol kinase family lipid kinase [Bacteroidales bacterium]